MTYQHRPSELEPTDNRLDQTAIKNIWVNKGIIESLRLEKASKII